MRAFVHDIYAPLNHKQGAFGDGTRRPGVASWVPPEEGRRLAAYQVLAAYRDNVARYYLPDSLDDDQVAKYREYGHADRLITEARTALMGNEQTLDIPGAELAPEQDGETPTDSPERKALEWLREWAKTERLWLKMALAESDSIGLGDAVWTLYWDETKQRPRIKTYDPGFYFPVLVPGEEDDFPSKVHIAWEETDASLGKVWLHRLTWSLEPIRPQLDPDRDFGTLQYQYTEQGLPVPQPGDRLDADGFLVRDLPWNTKPTRLTCLFTHAVWDLKNVKGALFDLDERAATFEVTAVGEAQHARDLRIDFLPVVHQPNTPTGPEHFGRSLLLLIAQVLDDISYADSDLMESASLVGNASLVTEGAPAGDIDVGPGERLVLPKGASAKYLDTSRNLDALLKLLASLKDTLSENSRVSKAALGRVDGSNAVSGLALALSFSPTEALVRDLRAVRDEKYPVLLRFALRFAQLGKLLDAGATPAAQVKFGTFLPADKAQTLTMVAAAVKARVMSTHTAVLELQRVGFSVEDAAAEVERIQRENVEAAVALVDATGDVAAARAYLGLNEQVTGGAGGA